MWVELPDEITDVYFAKIYDARKHITSTNDIEEALAELIASNLRKVM